MPIQVHQQPHAAQQPQPPLVVQWLLPPIQMHMQLAHPDCSTSPPAWHITCLPEAPTDVDTCCKCIDSIWQAAKGQTSCPAPIQSSWKATGSQWSQYSDKLVAHRDCSPNCRQLTGIAWLTHETKHCNPACALKHSTTIPHDAPYCRQTWWWQLIERLAKMHH